MIRCIIVDDELHAIDLLKSHIEKTPGLQLIHSTTKPREAIAVAVKEKADLLFLDVEMPVLNGFDVISSLQRDTQVILCSGHSKYALKGFDVDVLDYLLKPVTYARFMQSIRKLAGRSMPLPSQEHMFISPVSGTGKMKIAFADILLIESKDHYLLITVKNERHILYKTMREMMHELPSGRFIRVHKSYIVPVAHVELINTASLRLSGAATTIPIGKTYRKKVFTILNLPVK